MVQRLVGTDTSDTRLPDGVVDATIGTGPHDLAAGNHTHAGGGGGGSQATATALVSTLNPAALNQSITFTATVTAGGLPVTSGLVQFKANGANLGALTPVNLLGLANLTVNTLVGTPVITAVFTANALFGGSTSSPVNQVIISPPATTTALVATETAIDVGESVTYTATVHRSDTGATVNSGSVSFKRGANAMASGLLVNGSGVAVFTTALIPVGSWDVTAVYDGGTTLQASTSAPAHIDVTLVGGPAPTTAALVSDDATSLPGQTVTFTVTVTRTVDGIPVTSGTVAFRDGATVLIAGRPIDPATGTATYTTSALSTATHPITAVYSGGAIYQNSTSNVSNQIVAIGTGGAPISQTPRLSKQVVQFGDVVTVRTTVRSGGGAPTMGTVVFKEGATVLGDAAVHQFFGEWELTTRSLSIGDHEITAYYTGGASYEDDVSSPITVTVVAALADPGYDWATAIASKNLSVITAWYAYHCGVFSEGFLPSSLWNPAGSGSNALVDITDSWLTTNEGANVVNDGGGHWTVTGLRSTRILVRRSHLTLNHCFVYRDDYANQWGSGIDGLNATMGPDTSWVDITINRCTVATDGTSSESTYGDGIGFTPNHVTADAWVNNYCEITQFRAGCLMYQSQTMNYSWVHDLNLFGAEPHNTASSIRGPQCRLNRNLYADGTSSDVSLYADINPYTDFWVNENVMWIDPTHSLQEVNFPNRSTGWSPLLPGYTREFTDNKLQRGLAGDNMYWSKVSGNTLITGEPLFGGAATLQIPTVPTVLAGMNTGLLFGATPTMTSYYYTSSPSSVLLMFEALGRANHLHDPDIALTDEAGLIWAPVPGAETPVENAQGNTAVYGISGSVWHTTSTSGAQAPHRLIIDPYGALTSVAYQAMLVIEVTGLTALTLAQAPKFSALAHDVPFGGTITTMASGQLDVNTTAGNLVMLFVCWTHEVNGMLVPPAGWNVLGNNFEKRISAACLWRKDFVGRKVTVPDMGEGAAGAVTILMEVVMP